jgi:hypothetical protein
MVDKPPPRKTYWFTQQHEWLIFLAMTLSSAISWQHLATLKHTISVAKVLPKSGIANDRQAQSH